MRPFLSTMTALAVLRRKREAELGETQRILGEVRRACDRLEADLQATATRIRESEPPPPPGQALDPVFEATRQAHLAGLRALMQRREAAAVEARARVEAARGAVAEALRAMKAVEVLEQRAARAAADHQGRREAAETEDRNRK